MNYWKKKLHENQNNENDFFSELKETKPDSAKRNESLPFYKAGLLFFSENTRKP